MPLDNDTILALYTNRRKKGMYVERLDQAYNDSDEAGIDPAEDWPLDFANKVASTMYQGFRNAAETLGIEDKVEIMNRDGHVFILFTDRVNVILNPTETDADTE